MLWLRTWQLGAKSLLLHPLRSLLVAPFFGAFPANAFTILVPPLRDRVDEVPELATRFLR